MTFVNFYESQLQQQFLEQLQQVDWSAARYLVKRIEENKLKEEFGEDIQLWLLVENDQICSFGLLAKKGCIEKCMYSPWISFLYTYPEYRHQHLAGKLINFLCVKAASKGYKMVYLASDHTGIYEKYGFSYVKNEIDKYGIYERIYMRFLTRSDTKYIPIADRQMMNEDQYERGMLDDYD